MPVMTSWHDHPCTGCGATGARTHIGEQVLCNACTNRVLWADKGLPMPPDPPPDDLVTGPDGIVHRMRYEVSYSAVGPSAEALEVGGRYGDAFGGFQFRYWGSAEQSFEEVVAALRVHVHAEIGRDYIDDIDGRPALVDPEVRGRIGGEEVGPGEVGPTVWIDGAPVAWSTLGEMLTSYEGWQFHLRLDG